MVKTYRYELRRGSKKDRCPRCNQVSFKPYHDTEIHTDLADGSGRCDREQKCGYHKPPQKSDEVEPWHKPAPTAAPPKLLYFANHLETVPPLHIKYRDILAFTEIDTYNSGDTGIKHHHTLISLAERLNTFIKTTDDKTHHPAILKGLYYGGTAGQYCKTEAPFLFFDIDVKPTENKTLMDDAANNAVFRLLKDVSVLVWRSNSKKGMAGILYAPDIKNHNHTDTESHLKKAKAIYTHLAECIKIRTGIDVVFDWQQGKFRQIRYLAEQDEPRHINPLPWYFYSMHTTEPAPRAAHVPRFIPDEVLSKLEANRTDAAFLQNLITSVQHPWPADDVWMRAKKYRCGAMPATDPDMAGAIAFPFIDASGRCHSIQIKSFDQTNHTTGQTWVHSILRKKGYQAKWLDDYESQKDVAPLTRCLFGEHLIKKPDSRIIAIVEAPKTAIICDFYFAEYDMIWLAAGAKSWLKMERCQALKGRKVIFFPDASESGATYAEWLNKATAISKAIGFTISFNDMLERLSDEVAKKSGSDLADILLAHPWPHYRTNTLQKMINQNPHIKNLVDLIQPE